jgi:hypothetical protein
VVTFEDPTASCGRPAPEEEQHVHVVVKKDGKKVDPVKHMKIKDPPKKPEPKKTDK